MLSFTACAGPAVFPVHILAVEKIKLVLKSPVVVRLEQATQFVACSNLSVVQTVAGTVVGADRQQGAAPAFFLKDVCSQ